MTLTRAIEILELSRNGQLEGSPEDLEKAEQLGMEAMKRIREQRGPHRTYLRHLLPGETEENK